MLSIISSVTPYSLPIPFRSYPLLVANDKHRDNCGVTSNKDLSEINAGKLINRKSVYLHLEQGLAKNPNGPAIISTHQHAEHVAGLLSHDARRAKVDVVFPESTKEYPQKTNGETDNSKQQSTHYVQNDCLRLSYAQVHYISQNLAAGMLASGAQHTSTILILVPNGAEFGLLLWTSVMMRLTFVCADPEALRASGPDELRYILQSLKPSIIAVSGAYDAEAVDALVSDLRLAQPLRICLDNTNAPLDWKSLGDLVEVGSHSCVEKDELLENARNDDPRRVHSILFTSGTSGRPKGCPMRVEGMTHILHSQAWLLKGDACRFALQQAHPSRGIAPAQILQTWRAGGAVVMTGRGLSVEDAAHAIPKHKITFLVLTPPMVHSLADAIERRSFDVDSVRAIQVGGDAVTRSVLTRCATLFPRADVFVNHGMTEGGGAFVWPFFNTPVSQIPYFGQICPVGAVAPGSIVRIWDADEKRLARRGESGELHICCGSTINHYLFGASESSFYNDSLGRWFITGDIARIDAAGFVFIFGRAKDVIKRAGVTVMPAPLESCIEEFVGTATTVVAVPNALYGHELLAVLADLNGKHADEIKTHIMNTLGSHYTPSRILSLRQLGLDEFPVNATHKIMKSEVQRAVLNYMKKNMQGP